MTNRSPHSDAPPDQWPPIDPGQKRLSARRDKSSGAAFDAATQYLERLRQANFVIRLIVPMGLACWVGYGLASAALQKAMAEIAAGTTMIETALDREPDAPESLKSALTQIGQKPTASRDPIAFE